MCDSSGKRRPGDTRTPDCAAAEQQFQAVQQTLYLCDDRIWPVMRGCLGVSRTEEVLRTCLARQLCALRSLSRLECESDFQAIAMLARLVYEVSLDIGLLSGGGVLAGKRDALERLGKTLDERVDRALAFGVIQQQEHLRQLDNFHRDHPGRIADVPCKFLRERLDAGEERAREERNRWPECAPNGRMPNHWTNMNLGQRAKCFDLEVQEIYHGMRFWNHLAHSDPAGVLGKTKAHLNWGTAACLESVVKMIEFTIQGLDPVFRLTESVPGWQDEMKRLRSPRRS